MQLQPVERELALQMAAELYDQWPGLLLYKKHSGHEAFHRANHVFRVCAPGNGWGKTAAVAREIGFWIAGWCQFLTDAENTERFPKWPRLIFIVINKFDQWEKIRSDWEKWWPKGWTWTIAGHKYTWPDGTRVFLISGDTDWSSEQGTNPDLIAFDETCPAALWRELRMRRRGQRKTRFIFAATQTAGFTWMYTDLYLPWLKWHQAHGYSERQAMQVQKHEFDDPELAGLPGIWCWPYGGAEDNPANNSQDVALYRQAKFATKAEAEVRRQGGFKDFSGLPVFNLEALATHSTLPGVDGSLVDDWQADKDGRYDITTEPVWKPGEPYDGGRITIYELPEPNGNYVIGYDGADGMEGRDYDNISIRRRETGEQVATAMGHWGGDGRLSRTLARLHRFYNGAFICGERQRGLVHARLLLDLFGIGYQYCNRDELAKGRKRRDALCYHRTADDVALARYRIALGVPADRCEIKIRDPETLRQLNRYQYTANSRAVLIDEAGDADVGMGAPSGDHDDAVSADCYAFLALREVARFEEQKPRFKAGSHGARLAKQFESIMGPERVEVEVDPFAL